MKKLLTAIVVMSGLFVTSTETTFKCEASESVSAYDTNSDGFIYKGTVTLIRVASGRPERFYLFNKRGVDYVAKSKSGPYYRLARRMTIDNVEYKY